MTAVIIAIIHPTTGMLFIAILITRQLITVAVAIFTIPAIHAMDDLRDTSVMICPMDHATVPSVTSVPMNIPTISITGAIGSTNSKKLIFKSSMNACIRFCFSAYVSICLAAISVAEVDP